MSVDVILNIVLHTHLLLRDELKEMWCKMLAEDHSWTFFRLLFIDNISPLSQNYVGSCSKNAKCDTAFTKSISWSVPIGLDRQSHFCHCVNGLVCCRFLKTLVNIDLKCYPRPHSQTVLVETALGIKSSITSWLLSDMILCLKHASRWHCAFRLAQW